MNDDKIYIAIKKIRDYGYPRRELLESPIWEYATYDDYSGSFSTGMPCFSGFRYSKSFDSIKEAILWYKKEKKDLLRNSEYYDLSSVRLVKVGHIAEIKINNEEEI